MQRHIWGVTGVGSDGRGFQRERGSGMWTVGAFEELCSKGEEMNSGFVGVGLAMGISLG